MIDPQRYELLNDDMCPCPDGYYVPHRDYRVLQDELNAAREEAQRLREAFANRVILVWDSDSVRLKFASTEHAKLCYEAITRIPINAQWKGI